jgi:hypothetical protein
LHVTKSVDIALGCDDNEIERNLKKCSMFDECRKEQTTTILDGRTDGVEQGDKMDRDVEANEKDKLRTDMRDQDKPEENSFWEKWIKFIKRGKHPRKKVENERYFLEYKRFGKE